MGRLLSLDCETSGAIRNKGHPFDYRNKLCWVTGSTESSSYIWKIEYDASPYGDNLRQVQSLVDDADLIIGMNWKFDYHWLRRYGIKNLDKKRIWDCQLAYFLLHNQRVRYPSQDDICKELGLPTKPPIIHELWKKGVDSDEIPVDVWQDYLKHDGSIPLQIYQRQIELIRDRGLSSLMQLQCEDLPGLADMEWNGLKYDTEESKRRAEECEARRQAILRELETLGFPREINWDSPDQLSCVLYGGTLTFEDREENGVFKSGAKKGQTRYKKVEKTIELPALVKPLPGTELKKEGRWSTDEDTLVSLKAKGIAKKVIELVLSLSRISKLHGTYYQGLLNKFETFGWENGIIHHNLNQCVVVTGRLSSSNPNGQNMDKEAKDLFVSRYDD